MSNAHERLRYCESFWKINRIEQFGIFKGTVSCFQKVLFYYYADGCETSQTYVKFNSINILFMTIFRFLALIPFFSLMEKTSHHSNFEGKKLGFSVIFLK